MITGPYNDNSKEIARLLRLAGGAVEVADAPALARSLREFPPTPACGSEWVLWTRLRRIAPRQRRAAARAPRTAVGGVYAELLTRRAVEIAACGASIVLYTTITRNAANQ